MKLKTKKSTLPKIIIAIIIVAIVIAGYFVVAKSYNYWPFQQVATPSETTQQDDTDNSSINDTPATSEDQTEANKQKEATYERNKTTEESDKSTNGSSSKKNVGVTITTAYQEKDEIHVNGFVTGVIEGNGTCTLTLTDESGKKVTATRQGHENATNTTCGQSTIKTSQLHSGNWTASLSYSSSTASGNSDNNPTIEVK